MGRASGVYLVFDADGGLESTHVAEGWDQHVAAQEHARKIGGVLVMVPVLKDFRPGCD